MVKGIIRKFRTKNKLNNITQPIIAPGVSVNLQATNIDASMIKLVPLDCSGISTSKIIHCCDNIKIKNL